MTPEDLVPWGQIKISRAEANRRTKWIEEAAKGLSLSTLGIKHGFDGRVQVAQTNWTQVCILMERLGFIFTEGKEPIPPSEEVAANIQATPTPAPAPAPMPPRTLTPASTPVPAPVEVSVETIGLPPPLPPILTSQPAPSFSPAECPVLRPRTPEGYTPTPYEYHKKF